MQASATVVPMATKNEIAQQVVESILAQKLAPGERLGEQQLADLFGVSRTLVREALMQLQARGFVEVRPRKGWYVVEPSFEEAGHAFNARRVVETGLLRDAGKPLQSVIRQLRQHVAQERDSLAAADTATRSFLLADFHVCLARCLGNPLLVDVIRDLTARTTLVATLYQSTHGARQSCDEHEAIVAAMASGDLASAEQLMATHIRNVNDALVESSASDDPRERLRASLAPLSHPKPALVPGI
jgi:DNA-binding GntR family transcriptional regulator